MVLKKFCVSVVLVSFIRYHFTSQADFITRNANVTTQNHGNELEKCRITSNSLPTRSFLPFLQVTFCPPPQPLPLEPGQAAALLATRGTATGHSSAELTMAPTSCDTELLQLYQSGAGLNVRRCHSLFIMGMGLDSGYF